MRQTEVKYNDKFRDVNIF